MKQFGKNTKFFLHKTLCKKKIPDGLRFRYSLQKKAEQDHGLVMLTSTKQGNRRYFNKTQKDLCAPCRRKVSQFEGKSEKESCSSSYILSKNNSTEDKNISHKHGFSTKSQNHLYKATKLQ